MVRPAPCRAFAANNIRVDDVELPVVQPKKAFMLGALEKEIRLSFAQRIKGTLPEQYHALLPDGNEEDQPPFKYLDDRMYIVLHL